MIRERLLALRERRAALVARAEHQREGVALLLARAERATAWFERGRAAVRRARAHPVWIAAAVAVLVALRPRKALKWFTAGISLWRGWRRLRATLERLGVQPPVRA